MVALRACGKVSKAVGSTTSWFFVRGASRCVVTEASRVKMGKVIGGELSPDPLRTIARQSRWGSGDGSHWLVSGKGTWALFGHR